MEKSLDLKSPELMPAKEEEKDLNLFDLTVLWAGMAVELAGFMTAAQLYPGSAPGIILAGIGIGVLIVIAAFVLIGDIGITYGIPFIVYMRGCFGYKGSNIAGIVRVLPCMFWFGFQTFIAAEALDIIAQVTLGRSNFYVMLIVFAALQIINAAYGIKAMAKFDWVAAPALAFAFAAAIVWLFNVKNMTLTAVLAAPSDNTILITAGILATAGGLLSFAMNSPDFTRKIKISDEDKEASFIKRNKNVIIGQLIGIGITTLLLSFIGLAFGILTGMWDPVEIMVELFGVSNKLVIIPSFLIIIFSQWSTNTAANLMPPAYILVNMFPKLNYAKSTVITGVLGMLLMPWKFGNFLVPIQVAFSGFMGPVVGITIADYYFIRKRKLNIKDLYESDGQYKYKGNYNPAAIWTLIVSSIIGMIFLDNAFFVSFILSLILYVILMKMMVLEKYEQNLGQVILLDRED